MDIARVKKTVINKKTAKLGSATSMAALLAACGNASPSTSSATTLDLTSLNGTDGFRMDGPSLSGSGFSVSGAGDINGDGYDDVIVGAIMNSGGDGSSYVVFGKGTPFVPILDFSALTAADGFQLNGANGEGSGRSVSIAGDINGDGYDDLIIGAANANGNNGSSYVVFGKASGFGTITLSSLGSDGFQLDGGAGYSSGFSVSGAGDINGDGYDDLIIGGYNGNTGNSNSFVVFGKAAPFSQSIDITTLTAADGFQLTTSSNDAAGYSVSNAGDVNGDGYDDLIIGALSANGTDGASYVVFGKGTGFGTSLNLSALNGSDGFRLDGANGEGSGQSVSAAGDINGDGYDDLIIGTASANGNLSTSYVVFGKAAAFNPTLNLSTLTAADGFQLNNGGVGDYYYVSGAGDVNGDGYDDLIVAGDGIDAYLVFGKATGFGTAFDLTTIDGTNGMIIDRADSSVSAAGDVNGDGYDDLILGEISDASNGVYSGSSYVLFGGAQFPTSASAIAATAGDDTLTGTAGADALNGGQGNDSLSALAGDDILIGGVGVDTLDGGTGADKLWGGGDLDMFSFAAGDSASGYDIIFDFATNTATSNSEVFDTVGTASVVADTAGTDGADSVLTIGGQTVKSHSISNGIVSFDDVDGFASGLDISSNGDVAAVIEYLQAQDLGNAGATVAFDYGSDAFIFTQGDAAGTDNLDVIVKLEGVEVDSLITVNGTGAFDLFIA